MMMSYGGSVALSIPDPSKVDEAKATAAFRHLWRDAAAGVLARVPRDRTETGATFSATAEDYEEFKDALRGTGVEAELLLEPPTRAMLAALQGG